MLLKTAAALTSVSLLVRLVLVSSQAPRDPRDLRIIKRPPIPRPVVRCDTPTNFFCTDVVVTFDGDLNQVDGGTLSALEQSFQDTFNTLAKDYCDEFYRTVVDVSVAEDTLIQSTTSLTQFTVRLDVEAGCVDCPQDTDLFAPENLRRTMLADEGPVQLASAGNDDETMPSNSRRLRGDVLSVGSTQMHFTRPPVDTTGFFGSTAPQLISPATKDNCECPPDGPRRSPTANEVAAAFNTTFNGAGSARALQAVAITAVMDVAQVTVINCSEDPEVFETLVEIGFNGDPEVVADSEIKALEDSFVDSYNSIDNYELCDPFFRSISNVTIVGTATRRLQQGQGQDFRYRYKVNYSCRGCGSNQRLFDEVVGRRELLALPEMRLNRQLQFVFTDLCFCAIGSQERGVAEVEFTNEYNDNLNVLKAEGVIENVDTAVVTIEVPQNTWSPTTSPTNFPTAPTDSPVPSPSPSETPSA